MKRGDFTKIKITHQGSVVVQHAYVVSCADNLAAIAIDMKTKYADISSWGTDGNYPNIIVEANENSLHLKKGVDKESPTMIDFTDFKDYDIHCANTRKYTISICLIKHK